MMLQKEDIKIDNYGTLQKDLNKNEKILNKYFHKSMKEFKKTKELAKSIYQDLYSTLEFTHGKKEEHYSYHSECNDSTSDSDKNYSETFQRVFITNVKRQKKHKWINLKIRNSLIAEADSKSIYNNLSRYLGEELESKKETEKNENFYEKEIDKKREDNNLPFFLDVCSRRSKEKSNFSEKIDSRNKEDDSNCLVI